MDKQKLNDSFKNTNYTVFKNETFKKDFILRIGTVSDFNDFLPEVDYWAFITAWNPLPSTFSDEVNKQRNMDLLNDLNKYTTHKGRGISDDGAWFEDSLFIENITEKEAHFYAHKYGQLAFIFGKKNTTTKLLYCKSVLTKIKKI